MPFPSACSQQCSPRDPQYTNLKVPCTSRRIRRICTRRPAQARRRGRRARARVAGLPVRHAPKRRRASSGFCARRSVPASRQGRQRLTLTRARVLSSSRFTGAARGRQRAATERCCGREGPPIGRAFFWTRLFPTGPLEVPIHSTTHARLFAQRLTTQPVRSSVPSWCRHPRRRPPPPARGAA